VKARILIPALLVLLLLAACRAPLVPDLTYEGGSVTDYNLTLDYAVWLPDGYENEPTRKYPVLVWFHGAGENELGWGREGRIGGIVHKRVRRGELQPFIIVSPSAGKFKPLLRTYEHLLIDKVLPDVARKYRTNGITVGFGHSMGGLSALIVALRNPTLFKAVVVASPFTFDTTPWDKPEDQAAYGEKYGDRFLHRYRQEIAERFASREKYDEWAPWSLVRAMNGPFPCELLVTVGDRDELGLLTHISHFHEVLVQKGIRHEWHIQANVGHGTVEDPRLMDWLNERAK
jgi:enterochelin esterase-like enzyme